MGQDLVGEVARGHEPALVERGLVQREQSVGEVRVVLEHAGMHAPGRPSTTVCSRPSAIATCAAAAGRLRVRRRRPSRGWPTPRAASAKAAIGRPFQAVSTLSSRAGCGRRSRTRRAASSRGSGQSVVVGPRIDARQDVVAFPVAVRRHAVGGVEAGARQRPSTAIDLRLGPDVGRALFAVRVGVEARGEATVRRAQLARHELERLLDDLAVARVARSAARRACRRARAARCRRASSRSAAPARPRRSRSARSRRRAGRRCRPRPSRRACAAPSRAAGRRRVRTCMAQQELDRHRLRKLGRAAPAAVARVEVALQRRPARASSIRRWSPALARPPCAAATRCVGDGARPGRCRPPRSRRAGRATPRLTPSSTSLKRRQPVARRSGK